MFIWTYLARQGACHICYSTTQEAEAAEVTYETGWWKRQRHTDTERKSISTRHCLRYIFKNCPWHMAYRPQEGYPCTCLIQMERCSSGIRNLPNGPYTLAEAPCGCLVFELWSGLWMTSNKPPCVSIKASFLCFLNSSDKVPVRQKRGKAEQREWKVGKFFTEKSNIWESPHISLLTNLVNGCSTLLSKAFHQAVDEWFMVKWGIQRLGRWLSF